MVDEPQSVLVGLEFREGYAAAYLDGHLVLRTTRAPNIPPQRFHTRLQVFVYL
jgi:hypothetical protein